MLLGAAFATFAAASIAVSFSQRFLDRCFGQALELLQGRLQIGEWIGYRCFAAALAVILDEKAVFEGNRQAGIAGEEGIARQALISLGCFEEEGVLLFAGELFENGHRCAEIGAE